MKKENIIDTLRENEHFSLGDKNGKRIPQIWETQLANLSPEAKKRMADDINKSYQEKISKDIEHKKSVRKPKS